MAIKLPMLVRAPSCYFIYVDKEEFEKFPDGVIIRVIDDKDKFEDECKNFNIGTWVEQKMYPKSDIDIC